MEEHIKSTPKDVFLHLFNIVTFYLSVVGFITLYIQYINALFPDALNYYFFNIASGVRWSTAVLFIAVPAYLLTAWLLSKDLATTPAKRELKLRKWLVYFTLFVSAITVIVDLMIFVYHFLDGELTMRFFLKVLVVLVVAAAVFGYYLWDLKRTIEKSKLPKILAIAVLVVALGSIILGFFIIGTPTDQRNRRFDEQRIQALQMIQGQIINYWQTKAVLPTELSKLADSISGFTAPLDPDNNAPYEYKVTGPLAFELCANFSAGSEPDAKFGRNEFTANSGPYNVYDDNWNHEAGRICFSRTIDPELYKIDNAGVPTKPAPIVR
ncbi:MAG: hypothetical protein A3J93_00100 [Candidatus Magasanikbacteria bacterium RIFOXYC2_FULL_42_28]|uniref:DUF5671 domain-containing protein n=1 Tax=Candidatus Magasanikbacteria bacterium RIFOXYC2_FULL_42_28 TaxID=1798704 RepID=A0A1F6NW75_9BACT|nr:MAG: hypothetical protein A3J93_00100 [Candidatus Magasanikbacteria bacterium RIFOXYC2_FULL_42_28]